jgi:hypothetical protein
VTGTEDDRAERQQQLAAVVAKILGIAVAVGLVIGIGAWVLVKAIGLDAGGTTASGPGPGPATPLPTPALPVPSATPPTDNPGLVETTSAGPADGQLFLSASPVLVRPMERINLTGQWAGHDNQSLLVQRYEDGAWADFGVQVRVDVGTFATYVMTGRPGDQRFRVYDPTSRTASNEVTVTVGS